jgi:hypothetical protein
MTKATLAQLMVLKRIEVAGGAVTVTFNQHGACRGWNRQVLAALVARGALSVDRQSDHVFVYRIPATQEGR